MSIIYSQVGKKIRLFRKARNLTQEELGEKLQIDQSYLGRIERGEVNITLDTLAKISEALSVSPSQLFDDDTFFDEDEFKAESLDKIESLLIPLTNEELQGIHRILKEVLVLKGTTR
ncbi:helix-turn-helix transcriptional regulator [Paenibacillus sp. FSL H8-0457]|uniref:helix-turn-helix domain-containing protein n=1 Tax=unclassified Paenibacillus TaxID=185978 RepID=UPI0003E2BC1A|nr:helix-turn-helix transcriptional regulator [Paenibacillus sp. FSL H8-457]ETT57168.1 HTH-type transcriptional regulator y4wC [Paenibacillus sp. FSL H8-457]